MLKFLDAKCTVTSCVLTIGEMDVREDCANALRKDMWRSRKSFKVCGTGRSKVGVAMMPSGYDASVTFEDFVQLLLYYHLMDVVQWSGVICLIVRRTGLRT